MGNLESSKVYQISLGQGISKVLICKHATCSYLSLNRYLLHRIIKLLFGAKTGMVLVLVGYNLVGKVGIYHIIMQIKRNCNCSTTLKRYPMLASMHKRRLQSAQGRSGREKDTRIERWVWVRWKGEETSRQKKSSMFKGPVVTRKMWGTEKISLRVRRSMQWMFLLLFVLENLFLFFFFSSFRRSCVPGQTLYKHLLHRVI